MMKIGQSQSERRLFWLKGWRPYFLLFTVGFLLYSQTLFFDYTYFDDQALILEQQEILGSVQNIGRIFADDVFFSPHENFYYRPLLNLTLMADTQAGLLDSGLGTVSFFFHFSNIIFHLLSAGLIFYLLDRLLRKRLLAFILTLLFLVHPALVPAVAWIPGRNDPLLAIFVLSAFICFLNFLRQPRWRSYLGFLFLFFLALLTKETALGLPLAAASYFLLVDKGRLKSGDKILLATGSGLVIFIWFIMRRLAFGLYSPSEIASWPEIFQNMAGLLVFAGNIILPVNLSVLPILKNVNLIWGVLGAAVLAAISLIYPPCRYRHYFFGLFWAAIFILPTLLNPDPANGFLSHRLYLSFFGFLLILGEFEWRKIIRLKFAYFFLIISIIFVILAALTIAHSRSFRDRMTFWRQAVSDSPDSPLANRNFGVMNYLDGYSAAALDYYRRAEQLNPNEPMIHNNIGVIYLERRDYLSAEKEFYRELEVNPGYGKAIANLNLVRRLLP